MKKALLSDDKIRECGDCKKRDNRIIDLENRIKELTDYIKNSNDRFTHDRKKYDDDIRKLQVTN
jgi:hypothetical protein